MRRKRTSENQTNRLFIAFFSSFDKIIVKMFFVLAVLLFASSMVAMAQGDEARLTWQTGPWTVTRGETVDFQVLLEKKGPIGPWNPWVDQTVHFKVFLGAVQQGDTESDTTDANGIAEILDYDTTDLSVNTYSVEASTPYSIPTADPVYQTLTILNHVPEAYNDSYPESGSFYEYEDMSVPAPGILGNDDDHEPLTVYSVNGSTGNVGTWLDLPSGARLYVYANGAFEYETNDAFWDMQTGDSPYVEQFTYTAHDGMDESNTATVSITITGVDTLVLTAVPDTVDFGSIPGPGSYSESSSHLELTSDDNWSVSDNILWSDPGTSFPAGADQATVQKIFSLDYNPKTGAPGQSINISAVYYLDIEDSDMLGLPPGSYSIVVEYTATHTGP